jgi:N-acetylmuramoyl-L-alanine amidase
MTKKNLALALAALTFLPSWGSNISGKNLSQLEGIPISAYMRELSTDYSLLPEESKKRMKEQAKKVDDYFNYRTDDFNKDSDERILARLILGEAEGCSKIEKIAVAYTALNRKKIREMQLKGVILEPMQYSCFNNGTESGIFLKDPLGYNRNEFLEDIRLAGDILGGKYKDPTNGADYYYQPNLVKEPSYWKNLIKIGKINVGKGKKSIHIFGKSKPSLKKSG